MPDTPATKALLVNRALSAELGLKPTYTVDQETTRGQQVDAAWCQTCDLVFSMHAWSFLRRSTRLIRQADDPDNGWKYAYDLPAGGIGAPTRYLRDPDNDQSLIRNYALTAGAMCCNEPVVWARDTVLADPETWQAGFRLGFIKVLAAHLAIAMQADEDAYTRLMREAVGTPSEALGGGVLGRAMAQDLASSPVGSPLLAADPLTMARYT